VGLKLHVARMGIEALNFSIKELVVIDQGGM
jgi:hypothetical protein